MSRPLRNNSLPSWPKNFVGNNILHNEVKDISINQQQLQRQLLVILLPGSLLIDARLKLLEEILSMNDFDINSTIDGQRIITIAVNSQNPQLVKAVLAHNPELNFKQKQNIHQFDRPEEDNFFFDICRYGNLEIVKMILEEDEIDIDQKNDDGQNALNIVFESIKNIAYYIYNIACHIAKENINIYEYLQEPSVNYHIITYCSEYLKKYSAIITLLTEKKISVVDGDYGISYLKRLEHNIAHIADHKELTTKKRLEKNWQEIKTNCAKIETNYNEYIKDRCGKDTDILVKSPIILRPRHTGLSANENAAKYAEQHITDEYYHRNNSIILIAMMVNKQDDFIELFTSQYDGNRDKFNPNYQLNEGDTNCSWARLSNHDNFLQTLFMIAAEKGYENLVRLILSQNMINESIYVTTELLDKIFFESQEGTYKKIADLLLNMDFKNVKLQLASLEYYHGPSDQAIYTGHFMMREAIEEKDIEMVKFFLNSGIIENINYKYNGGNTALMLAMKVENQEIIELLLENKADPIIANDEGRNALDIAGSQLILRKLLLNLEELLPDKNNLNLYCLKSKCDIEIADSQIPIIIDPYVIDARQGLNSILLMLYKDDIGGSKFYSQKDPSIEIAKSLGQYLLINLDKTDWEEFGNLLSQYFLGHIGVSIIPYRLVNNKINDNCDLFLPKKIKQIDQTGKVWTKEEFDLMKKLMIDAQENNKYIDIYRITDLGNAKTYKDIADNGDYMNRYLISLNINNKELMVRYLNDTHKIWTKLQEIIVTNINIDNKNDEIKTTEIAKEKALDYLYKNSYLAECFKDSKYVESLKQNFLQAHQCYQDYYRARHAYEEYNELHPTPTKEDINNLECKNMINNDDEICNNFIYRHYS